jgi:hypothetical protein
MSGIFGSVGEILNYAALRPEEVDWQYPLARRFPKRTIGLVSLGTSGVRIGKACFANAKGKTGSDPYQGLPVPELVTARSYGSVDEIVELIHELGDEVGFVAVTISGDTQVELLSKCDGSGGYEEQYSALDRNPDGVLARSTSPQETISVVHHPEVQNAIAFITETSRVESVERSVAKAGRTVVRMQTFFASALAAALQEQGTHTRDILLVEQSEFCFIGASPEGGWDDMTFRNDLPTESLRAAIIETIATRETRSDSLKVISTIPVGSFDEFYGKVIGSANENLDFTSLLYA